MKTKKVFYMVLFIIGTFTLEAQVDWPLHNHNQQARVVGTVGEVRGGVRIHRGTDINNMQLGVCSGTLCDVYAINTGFISWNNHGGNWGHGESFIRVGDVFYYHCKPTQSIINGGSNVNINAGTRIGTMISPGIIHVHLQESQTNYLNSQLTPYADTVAPVLIMNNNRFPNGYKIYRNGLVRTSTMAQQNSLELTTNVTHNSTDFRIIYSKVDLTIDVEDSRIAAGGSDPGGGQVAPYGYEFQLQDFDNPNVNAPLYQYNLDFDRAPPANNTNNSALNLFHPQSSGNGVTSTHIMTSHFLDTPFNRYFNTGIRENVAENWLGLNSSESRHYSEAEFVDNKYRLYMDAYDVANGINPNNRLANRVDVPVIIDNYLPYIDKVEVFDVSTDNLLYRANWNYTTPNNTPTLIWNKTADTPIFEDQGIKIRAYTSEVMKDLMLTFGSSQHTLDFVAESNGVPYYEVIINTNPPFLPLTNGLNVLLFEGQDLAENELLSNPDLLPVRQADGMWPPGVLQGNDTWYKLLVVDANTDPLSADFLNNVCNFPAPIPGLKVANNINCLEVCLMDASIGDVTEWLWEFGDFNSSTSTMQNPTFLYDSPGTYDVTLTITNDENETSSITKTITVDECSTNIIPFIVSDVTSGPVPLIVNFSDWSTGDIAERQWNISPTNGWQILEGNMETPNIKVLFYIEGDYEVNVLLEDTYGDNIFSNTIAIDVETNSNTDLFVDFETEGPVYTGSHIIFNSLVSQGCNELDYEWTFHDYNGPNHSTLPDPTYIFPVPGSYPVELCVTDNCGNYECVTKVMNISNYTSNVFAHMNAHYDNPNPENIVLKGQEIIFEDLSTPSEDILYGSWFFDYHEGISGPDLMYFYPEPPFGQITHTFNEVGTYRVRLYVGDDPGHFGSFEEEVFTVVDEYEYLEIPTIHESHRQVFNERLTNIRTKNFDGHMLAKSGNKIKVFQKNGNYNYNTQGVVIRDFENVDHLDYQSAKGYKDLIAITYEINGQIDYGCSRDDAYYIEIYERTGSNWSSFNHLQTITYPSDENLHLRILDVNMYDDVIVVMLLKNPIESTTNCTYDDQSQYIDLHEISSTSGLFEYKARLLNSNPHWDQSTGHTSFGSEMKLNDETIVVGEPDIPNPGQKIMIYKKTNIGWVNSNEDNKLSLSYDYANGFKPVQISQDNSTIIASNRYVNGGSGVHVYQKPLIGWHDNPENALMTFYDQNIEDGIFDERDAPEILSDNTNYTIGIGTPIRDFQFVPTNNYPNGILNALTLYYKDGDSWEDKTIEDHRLYPLGVTSGEIGPGDIDESENLIVTSFIKDNNTILYSYDFTGDDPDGGQPGKGVCFQNMMVENQEINDVQPGGEGMKITIQNTNINSGAGVIYQGIESIKIKTNTIIREGSYFKATMVDCNQIDQ